ncbi:transglycosylase SLT domain-containing protein [Pseudooceanicola sp. LIPI14-2-Ac024]|uniref:lytic transglycosylase domain-containing protein n=1 Tax=Pseudooceanicola sp. LIPI14-2-Ac024 TaxID=3344875 RepID=UPI0035CEF013
MAPRPLTSAFHAMNRGDWDTARALAARDGAVARDLVEWHRLRSDNGTLTDILAFLQRRPDWPGLDYMRKQGEYALTGASDADILAYFRDTPPQTGRGILLHAAALTRAGERGEAEAEIVLAWRSMELSLVDHEAFVARHRDLLKPHHAARLDMTLWRRWRDDSDRMQPLVTQAQWKLAQARLALQRAEAGVDERIDALTAEQKKDAGLAYDRFAWRVSKGRHDEARDLMLERSAIPGGLGMAEEWANRRRGYAREEMRQGRPDRAYRLASQHQLREGSDYADLEWLSGYIALRKLNDPATALKHFDNFLAAVETPISLGRGYYWKGRAFEEAGRSQEAQEAYAAGGAHQTTFYGLLAAEKAGMSLDPALTGAEEATDWRRAGLAENDLREATMLLLAAGNRHLAERFLSQLTDRLDSAQLASLGALLESQGETHLEVMMGKRAAQRSIIVPRHYYPLHPMTAMDLPVPMELALSIARRESEFDPRVTSQAGAGGLMQLMPGTARDVARGLGLVHEADRVWSDWSYNARLGSTYLAGLASDFGGNVLLVSAGYNAGPGRPPQWMALFGDPRSRVVDAVDWIEHIPFRETQNYVMRVAESLPIYRARLGKPPLPMPFSEELKGSTLKVEMD